MKKYNLNSYYSLKNSIAMIQLMFYYSHTSLFSKISEQSKEQSVHLCTGVSEMLTRGRDTCSLLKQSIDGALNTLIGTNLFSIVLFPLMHPCLVNVFFYSFFSLSLLRSSFLYLSLFTSPATLIISTPILNFISTSFLYLISTLFLVDASAAKDSMTNSCDQVCR